MTADGSDQDGLPLAARPAASVAGPGPGRQAPGPVRHIWCVRGSRRPAGERDGTPAGPSVPATAGACGMFPPGVVPATGTCAHAR